jgi:hypothetical protein
MYNAALIILLVAVSAASEKYRKRRNPDYLKKTAGDDRKFFEHYLISRDDRFGACVRFNGKNFTIAELVYQHLRCDLVHEAHMAKADLGVSYELISINNGRIFVGFGTLAALIDVLENDPEKTAQTSLGSSFSGLLPDEADFPTYVKNVDALEAKVIALKEEFDLSNGRISILKQIVVSAGPKFLMSSAKVEISKLVNDDWRKVMVWAGMNGGAETGLRLTAYPIVSGSEYNSEAPLEFTDHGVAVLKRLARHYVSKY